MHPITQALDDLISTFSPNQFRHLAEYTRTAVASTLAIESKVHHDGARRSVLQATDMQLQRACEWVEKEVDLMALVVRNLIELNHWAAHIAKGEDETIMFFKDGAIDARELWYKIKVIRQEQGREQPNDGPLFAEHASGDRIKFPKSNAAEDLIYKLCSKLIHPSAFSLNRLYESEGLAAEIHKTLCHEVIKYASNIITKFHNIEFTENQI